MIGRRCLIIDIVVGRAGPDRVLQVRAAPLSAVRGARLRVEEAEGARAHQRDQHGVAEAKVLLVIARVASIDWSLQEGGPGEARPDARVAQAAESFEM